MDTPAHATGHPALRWAVPPVAFCRWIDPHDAACRALYGHSAFSDDFRPHMRAICGHLSESVAANHLALKPESEADWFGGTGSALSRIWRLMAP